MRTVLGLDIGTNSIGWCLIDNKEQKIIHTGVRIIPMGDEKKEFEEGKSITKNAGRRTQRSMRRNNSRYKQRRAYLHSALRHLGMLPNDKLKFLSDPLELYGLRTKALEERINPEELGRVMLHLNQRRGYESNRKTDPDTDIAVAEKPEKDDGKKEKKASSYLDEISHTATIIAEGFKSPGHFFYEGLKGNPHFRVRNKLVLRELYEKEFNDIWDKQTEFYPELLTEKNREWLCDGIIFMQRKLRSQKHSISNCRFEPLKKAAPKSSPIFQECKIWQKVNSLRAENLQDIVPVEITLEQRQKLVGELFNAESLSEKRILKILGIPEGVVKLNFDKLDGHTTLYKLRKALKPFGDEHLAILDDPAQLEDIWHLLYSLEKLSHLKEALSNRTFYIPAQLAGKKTKGTLFESGDIEKKPFKLSPEAVKALMRVGFKNDYGSLSAKAMKKLLPHLKKGLLYNQACDTAYGKDSHSDNTQLNGKLEKFYKGSLRNPVVEQVLNETVGLVNAIMDDLGICPDGIRIELARHLKQDRKKREADTFRNRIQEKKRKEIREKLEQEHSFRRVSNNDITRYLLWEECNRISPYTGDPISFSDLFDRNKIDIEHIFPKSRFFDDSFLNKTLCERHINSFEKKNLTAWEYIERQSPELQAKLIGNITANFNTPDKWAKKKRLLAKEIPEDFVTRQLKETQYISKAIVERLRGLTDKVMVTSGSITSYLRDEWGLDDMFYQIVVGRPRDKQNPDNNEPFSKRDDHRHHAIDALVVACTTQGDIQRLNTLNEKTGSMEGGRKIPPPWPSFIARVKPHIEGILVSHRFRPRVVVTRKNIIQKKDGTSVIQWTKAVRGALHKDTVFGKIRNPDTGAEAFASKKPIADAFKSPDKIVDAHIRKLVKDRLAEFDGKDKDKKAIESLATRPIWQNEKKGIQVKTVRMLAKNSSLVPLHKNSIGEPIDYVDLRNNHHVAIYEDAQGQLQEKVVTFMEASERARQGLPLIDRDPEDGSRFVTSLMINEMFVFDLNPNEVDFTNPKNNALISKHLYRVQKISQGDYTFRHHLATSLDNKEQQIRVSSIGNMKRAAKVAIARTGLLQIVQ